MVFSVFRFRPFNVNPPFTSVMAPVVVPGMITVAPISGSSVRESITVPFNAVF